MNDAEDVTIEPMLGDTIWNTALEAVKLAVKRNVAVTFRFNGVDCRVDGSDTPETVAQRYIDELELASNAREKERRQTAIEEARKELSESMAAQAAAIRDAGVMTEEQMRDAEVPWFDTIEELSAYLQALADRPHDYGTSAYAMSHAAVAAFRFVAGKLGTTGAQAGAADLDLVHRVNGIMLGHTRSLKAPFMLVNGEKLLRPQYDLVMELEGFIKRVLPWARTKAREELASLPSYTNPDVKARLVAIADWREPQGVPGWLWGNQVDGSDFHVDVTQRLIDEEGADEDDS